MIIEKHLAARTLDNTELIPLLNAWYVNKKIISEKLNSISVYFPHFSLHDESHSNTICLNIERVLGDKRISKLSSSDLLLFLYVAYFHDSGMILAYDEVRAFFDSDESMKYLDEMKHWDNEDVSNKAKRLLSFYIDYKALNKASNTYTSPMQAYEDIVFIIEMKFRSGHANRSKKKINNEYRLEKSLGIRISNLMADICEFHQHNINTLFNFPYKTNGLLDDYIHPRFIASMLCLGDLLDLDTDRFNNESLLSSPPLPKDSKLHKEKHESIKHFLVEPNGIEITSDTNDVEVYKLMRDWTSWIKEVCNHMLINWASIAPSDFGNAPKLKSKLTIDGGTKWLKYLNLRFNISNKRAFEILNGSRIYDSKFICIREIIQNSIDATLLKIAYSEFILKKEELSFDNFKKLKLDDYKIIVSIVMTENNDIEISITDKGIGIYNSEIENIAQMSTKKSKVKNDIFKQMPDWMKPSGAFGLGIQSIFQLTNEFNIITKTMDEKAKQIVFGSANNGKGYIIVKDYDDLFYFGTKLSFIINKDQITNGDLHVPEYYYKTVDKSRLILHAINNNYNNSERFTNKQLFDYVPVKIEINEKFVDASKKQEITNYDTIFCNAYTEKKIAHNKIDFREYDEYNLCYMQLLYNISDDGKGNKLYNGKSRVLLNYTGNKKLYFKNVYVKDKIINESIFFKRAILQNTGFNINLLGGKASELLNYDRKSVDSSYKYEFEKTILDILENTLKKLIDYLIDEADFQSSSIGKVILVIYQNAKYYDYRVRELSIKFSNDLTEIIINGYYNIMNEEISYTFEELNGKTLYFLQPIDQKILDSEVDNSINDIIDVNIIDDENILKFHPDKTSFIMHHIIDHSIKSINVGKYKKKLYYIIESKAFESCKYENVWVNGKLILIDYFITAIIKGHRIIPAVVEYEELFTVQGRYSDYGDYLDDFNKAVIEFPLTKGDYVNEEIKRDLNDNGYLQGEIIEYLKKIHKTDSFQRNVEYIYEMNGLKYDKTKEQIKSRYTALLSMLFKLISQEKYKQYIKSLVEYNMANNNFSGLQNDKFKHNPYITFGLDDVSCMEKK